MEKKTKCKMEDELVKLLSTKLLLHLSNSKTTANPFWTVKKIFVETLGSNELLQQNGKSSQEKKCWTEKVNINQFNVKIISNNVHVFKEIETRHQKTFSKTVKQSFNDQNETKSQINPVNRNP